MAYRVQLGPIGAAIKGSYGVFRLFPKANESVNRHIPKTECMHWGLQIGPYLYELVTDEGSNGHLIWRRIYQLQPEFWQSDAPDRRIGSTCETDKQISEIGKYYHEAMTFFNGQILIQGSTIRSRLDEQR